MTFQELGTQIHELGRKYLGEEYNFSSHSIESIEFNNEQNRKISFKGTIHLKPINCITYISYEGSSIEELLMVLEIKLKNLNKIQDIKL